MRLSHLGAGIIALAAVVLFAFSFAPQSQPSFRLQYTRTGGIAAFNDTFAIEADGAVSFTSNHQKGYSTRIDDAILRDLKGVLERNIVKVSPTVIKARAGAADYFTYRLIVTINGKTTDITWVDEGVTEKKIPEALNLIHSRVVILQEGLAP